MGAHCVVYSFSTIDEKSGPVTLKKNCRVGSHSTVMPGVTIGENTIVGAHSFVNANLPPNVVAAGVPAKVVMPLEKYLEKLKKSVKIIRESGLDYEFRSTVLPSLHSRADIIKMAQQISGSQAYFLQQFRPMEQLVNGEYVTQKKYMIKELEEIKQEIKGLFKICRVR